jgi:energy-coupling factor transporter ATP-binding protein EcfA2
VQLEISCRVLRLLGGEPQLFADPRVPEPGQGKPLMHDSSLPLHRDTVVVLVGPNGAGKSSLLVAFALGEGTESQKRSTAGGSPQCRTVAERDSVHMLPGTRKILRSAEAQPGQVPQCLH